MADDPDRAAQAKPVDKHFKIGKWSVRLPKSRPARIALGSGLVAGGLLGFLPVLGFWMIPVGLVVLSQDIAKVRRFRRRSQLWIERRKSGRKTRAMRKAAPEAASVTEPPAKSMPPAKK